MRESLSVRAYQPVPRTHAHHFHQIVVPLRGAIDISLNDFEGSIAVGHCVIVRKQVEHSFRAQKQARFLVADLLDLPDAASTLDCPFATLSLAFRSFCLFVDTQLSASINPELEKSMIELFKQLLALQDFLPSVDRRISRALETIESDLSRDYSLAELAAISALSISQFKVLFGRQTRMTLGRYLLMLRMEKARALLVNTDMPVNLVAEQTGYRDQSAFSRRFRSYYGMSPGKYKQGKGYQ